MCLAAITCVCVGGGGFGGRLQTHEDFSFRLIIVRNLNVDVLALTPNYFSFPIVLARTKNRMFSFKIMEKISEFIKRSL
jgi:hypothetical protein